MANKATLIRAARDVPDYNGALDRGDDGPSREWRIYRYRSPQDGHGDGGTAGYVHATTEREAMIAAIEAGIIDCNPPWFEHGIEDASTANAKGARKRDLETLARLRGIYDGAVYGEKGE